MKVALFFEATVEVDVNADPNDSDAWASAIAEAAADIPLSEFVGKVECVGHECLEPG